MDEIDVMNEMIQIDQRNEIDERTGMTLKWYVIQTKAGDEHRVETHLDHQEIEAFLPLFETYQYMKGKMVQRIKPFFPSYLFARFDLRYQYNQVKWTRGVSKILGTEDGPIPISEKVIQSIKERVEKDNLVKLEEEWKEGDVVQITSGPLKDLMGVFHKKMSDNGRVRILLNLIGVDMPVQISQWQIKKAA